MCIIISVGKWGGIYLYKGFGFRVCLGWIAITYFPTDGDNFLELARRGSLIDQLKTSAKDLLVALNEYGNGECSFAHVLEYADDLKAALGNEMG